MLTTRADTEAPRPEGDCEIVGIAQPAQAAVPWPTDGPSETDGYQAASCLRENDGLDIVRQFLRLADVDKGAFDRLGRYEAALWRQVRQTIFTLEDLRWRASTRSWRSTIFGEIFNVTGGGKWVEITVHADPLYLHLLLTAEKKFWRCVMSGEEPRLFGVEPPRPRLEAVRIVDMSASNSWADFAAYTPDPARLPRARGRQGRPEKADARGCQGGDRTWPARQALFGPSASTSWTRRRPCTAPVKPSAQ